MRYIPALLSSFRESNLPEARLARRILIANLTLSRGPYKTHHGFSPTALRHRGSLLLEAEEPLPPIRPVRACPHPVKRDGTSQLL